MMNQIQDSLWRQFGAGIDMLINVISTCPEKYFLTNNRFYYIAYHSVILLDYYLTVPPEKFTPDLPFTIIGEEDRRPAESIGDMIPDKIYRKQEIIDYLKATRLKCKKLIESLVSSKNLEDRFTEGDQEGDLDYPVLEILLYNMRHTQHHIGQLNLIIRQDLNKHMEWAFRVDELN